MVGSWIGVVAALVLTLGPAIPSAQPALPSAVPASAQPASRSPELGALLLRHRHAIGALTGSSASWDGVISRSDTQIKYAAISDDSGHYKTTLSMPFGERVEGSDGIVHWVQDVNGNVTTDPNTRRRALSIRLLGFNGALLDEAVAWTMDGTAQLDGREVYRLRTKFGSYPALFYVDEQTALVDGVDVGARVVRYPEYARFGGLTLPTRIVETQDGASVTTTVTDVVFDPPTASFAPPPPRLPEFPAGRSDVSLNFDSPLSLIVVSARINGQNAKFLLDSGSSTSLIDIDEAKSLQLPMGGSSHVAGATMLTGESALADSLDLGGLRFHPIVLTAVPLGLPAKIRGFGIKGVLGFDVLAHVVVRISYARGQLQFIEPTAFRYGGNGLVLPLDATNRVPYVAATIGDKDPVTFTIDTGSNSGLTLYQDFASSHTRDFLRPGDLATDTGAPLDPNEAGTQRSRGQTVAGTDASSHTDVSSYFSSMTQASGAGGSIHVKTAYVSRLNLGDLEVDRVATEIVLQPTGAFVPTQSDGLVGAGVLSRFTAVFLDYSGGRFIVER
jgi:hypothetical protein